MAGGQCRGGIGSRVVLRVLTWNLFHGRAEPPAGRELKADFACALGAWDWDVALLQEVPSWWPPMLAHAAGAQERTARTARNTLHPVRRWVAERRPDLVKSNAGGSNAILVRGEIVDHRIRVLRPWPERRILHAVRTEEGLWAGNLHATVHHPARAAADIALAAETTLSWARGAPAVLGGDMNVPDPAAPGFVHVGGKGVDHLFARTLEAAAPHEVLDRGALSDHAPVVVALSLTPSRPSARSRAA